MTRAATVAGSSSATLPPEEMPSAATLRRLKLSPEVAWYMVSRGYKLPETPPQHKTPEPRTVKGAVFDPERVDKVLAVFHALRHTKGRLAGQPLDPDPWQIGYILAPVFGWIHLDDEGDWVRIITTLYVDVPRKNGKSTLAGGLGIYLTCSDGEPGAEVIAAATSKEQAGFVFAPVKQIAESAPGLRGKVRVLGGSITHKRTASVFKVVSSAGDAQHGANIHGAVIDELHLHKTPDLVEAIESGTGSRRQPLVVLITTADEGKPNTIYSRRRTRIEQLAKRVIKDPTTYGVIFAADESDPPFEEATYRKANPGYPISPTRRYLEGKALEASQSPAELASYQRLHLGIRTKQRSRYIVLRDWDRNAGRAFTRDEVRGQEAWGGIDLASVSDLTALCWLFPRDVIVPAARDDDVDHTVTGYRAMWHVWAPEAALPALDKRTAGAASLWVQQGFLALTPGDVTDYDWIRDQVFDDMDHYDVRSIGFDPYNATQLTNDLTAGGAPMVKVRQGFITLSPPTKEINRLVRIGRREMPMIEHGGNPIARWAVDNLAVALDAAGNVKPDKENAGDKIDPFSALATAMSEAMTRNTSGPPAYTAESGVTFL
jgi:phage terminase large subunit-like protein